MKEKLKKYSNYVIIFLTLIIAVLLYLFINVKECDVVESIELKNTIEEDLTDYYYIDIKGEVNNPGVYEVESDKRLIDLVEIAGGLTDNADLSLLNLSKKVEDETSIKIYSKKEVKTIKENLKEEPTVVEIIKEIEKECVCPEENYACISNDLKTEESDTEESELTNINNASKEKLMLLSGIGESKADAIIEYRSEVPFDSIEDIKNVSGIGDSAFEKIKDYITV